MQRRSRLCFRLYREPSPRSCHHRWCERLRAPRSGRTDDRAQRQTRYPDSWDHDHFADCARVAESNILPGLAAIDRLVDSVAMRNVAANASFARAHVDHVRVRWRNRQASDRRRSLFIENRRPGHGAVGGLPHTTAGTAEVVRRGIAGNARRRQRAAAAEWTHHAVFHALELGILVVGFPSERGFLRGPSSPATRAN